jgi:hypothetical protein
MVFLQLHYRVLASRLLLMAAEALCAMLMPTSLAHPSLVDLILCHTSMFPSLTNANANEYHITKEILLSLWSRTGRGR